MSSTRLALITFLDDQGGTPGVPTHPIVIPPGTPPGYWGGVAPPWVDNTLPGQPPYPSQGPGFPTPPIYLPGGPGTAPPPSGGHPGQLPASNPEGGGWVWGFVPGYGWMWSYVPNPNPPKVDNTLPTPEKPE